MGLPAPVAELLFAENSFKPIRGSVGFIGRQTTYLRENSLSHLAQLYGYTPPPNFTIEIDQSTRSSGLFNGEFITDRCLMSYLGAKSFKAIDVSDYEGADIVCDLSGSIPDTLHKTLDFVFDGSCLDNIFNPANALINISRLLRPGGRMVLLNHATWFNGPYSILSPGWYYDYFAANGYDDCQVFLGMFTNNEDLHLGPMNLYYYNWAPGRNGSMPNLDSGTHVMLIVVAEKGKDSTDTESPVQNQYRDKAYDESVFQKNAQRMMKSKRRLFSLQTDVWNNPNEFIQLRTLAERVPA